MIPHHKDIIVAMLLAMYATAGKKKISPEVAAVYDEGQSICEKALLREADLKAAVEKQLIESFRANRAARKAAAFAKRNKK